MANGNDSLTYPNAPLPADFNPERGRANTYGRGGLGVKPVNVHYLEDRTSIPVNYDKVSAERLGQGCGVLPFERGLKGPNDMTYSPEAMAHWRYRPDNGTSLSGVSFLEYKNPPRTLVQQVVAHEDSDVSCPEGYLQRVDTSEGTTEAV